MRLPIYCLVLALFSAACNESKKDPATEILKAVETKLNATESKMIEIDKDFQGQGVKRTLDITFINVKKVDIMDRAWKEELKTMVQQLKNVIEGSDRIEKYQVRMQKDPADTTPSKTGFNVAEKGFTFNREDLE